MTPAATPEALVDGDHDMPTDAEIQAMREEAENFRLPAPPPTPVRGRYYLTECEHCGWVGSSEHCGGNCGPDDDDIVCPVCRSSICGDEPDEADTAKHGEAVYQRIVQAEAALATATAEAASLRAEVEAKDRALASLADNETLLLRAANLIDCGTAKHCEYFFHSKRVSGRHVPAQCARETEEGRGCLADDATSLRILSGKLREATALARAATAREG